MGETRKQENSGSTEAATDSATNSRAVSRRSCYLGVDEARVEFLEAVGREVPKVFEDLVGDPFARHQEWVQLAADESGEPRPAAEYAACLRTAEVAYWKALREWKRRRHLRGRWCGERATELLEESEAGLVPWGTVDLVRDVSPVKQEWGGRLLSRYPDESGAQARRRMRDEADAQIAAFLARESGIEARYRDPDSISSAAVAEFRNLEHFAWAARWQCGEKTYEAIAGTACVDVETVKAAVHFVLAFIRLPRRTE